MKSFRPLSSPKHIPTKRIRENITPLHLLRSETNARSVNSSSVKTVRNVPPTRIINQEQSNEPFDSASSSIDVVCEEQLVKPFYNSSSSIDVTADDLNQVEQTTDEAPTIQSQVSLFPRLKAVCRCKY